LAYIIIIFDCVITRCHDKLSIRVLMHLSFLKGFVYYVHFMKHEFPVLVPASSSDEGF